MRWTSSTNRSLFVNRDEGLANMTVLELKELMIQNNGLVKQILYQGSNLRGSRPFWYARLGELTDMIEQLKLRTFFFILSCADLHWHDLFRIL